MLSNVEKRVPVGITQCLNALNAARSKSPRQGGTVKNQPMQNQIRAVVPKERFRSFDKALSQGPRSSFQSAGAYPPLLKCSWGRKGVGLWGCGL